MTTPTCSTCKHYFLMGPGENGPPVCRRYPPTAVMMMVEQVVPHPSNPAQMTRMNVPQSQGIPAPIGPDWSCGEHSPAPLAAAKPLIAESGSKSRNRIRTAGVRDPEPGAEGG